jgi:hypothetical protein
MIVRCNAATNDADERFAGFIDDASGDDAVFPDRDLQIADAIVRGEDEGLQRASRSPPAISALRVSPASSR